MRPAIIILRWSTIGPDFSTRQRVDCYLLEREAPATTDLSSCVLTFGDASFLLFVPSRHAVESHRFHIRHLHNFIASRSLTSLHLILPLHEQRPS